MTTRPAALRQQPGVCPESIRRCCRKHEAEDLKGSIFGRHFIVCPTCQDKRCPRAEDCANECQQPAQPGSGEVRRVSLDDEAAIEASLRFEDSEYQMAFCEGYTRATTIAGRRLTAAKQRIADLHAALRTYGWHKPECDYMQEELPCTCGFMDAVKEQGNG